MLDNETGEKTYLESLDHTARKGIANLLEMGSKTVYRHLSNGDPLLVNR